MLETEFIRNLNCNYERILLEEKPEENRYQYCIVMRGGIRGLLDCSLRYIDGRAYLYYDISSKQNLVQLYDNKTIRRQWVKDFLWGMRRIKQEMERFLLDDDNILWYPEQIFQDLEKNDFYFVYMPYHEGDNGFEQLLDYLVEHLDYEDETLVESVYKMHEQYRLLGKVYLSEQIYEDGRRLDEQAEDVLSKAPKQGLDRSAAHLQDETSSGEAVVEPMQVTDDHPIKDSRKGIRYFLEEKMRRQREERGTVRYRMENWKMPIQAVCEETPYNKGRNAERGPVIPEGEIGRTIYIEETVAEEAIYCGLFTPEGKEICRLKEQSVILGKKKEEVDCVLEDPSVSRMHARITFEKDGFYLEDLNSTNGTCKNGLRLQPYEKRRLDREDEIRLGKVVLIFR